MTVKAKHATASPLDVRKVCDLPESEFSILGYAREGAKPHQVLISRAEGPGPSATSDGQAGVIQ